MNGPPQKPITAWSGAQLAPHEPDRLEDQRRVSSGSARASRSTSARRPDRLRDDRADVLDELDVDAHAEHREHDVGEHHGRVHVVAATGWSVTSAQSSGWPTTSKSPCRVADLAVLRQRAARLAHEPDRRPLDRLAPRGADEERLDHAAYTSPAMARVGEHPVPTARSPCAGSGSTCRRSRAGALGDARLSSSRTPAARRGARGGLRRPLAYHWLDERGNPIVWDGDRAAPAPVAPGERVALRRPDPRPDPARPLPARARPRRRGPLLARRASATSR